MISSRLFLAAALCFSLAPWLSAAPNAPSRALSAILTSAPGSPVVYVGDQGFRRETLRAMRDELAGAGPNGATPAAVHLWNAAAGSPGVVYYRFDASVSSTIHQRAFLDAAAEWTAWGGITFVPRGAQANYVTVVDGGSGLGGGFADVGMIGGEQRITIGSTSWNRPTLCHEIGHALGFIHEQSRGDRDTYVNILTTNISSGASGNFDKLTTTNYGAYDFYSVMHYSRNAFSINPAPTDPANATANLNPQSDTIEPKPAYLAFLNIIGREYDRTLSKLDRAAIAAMYGPPAAAPGSTVTNTADSGPGTLRTAIYYAYDRSVAATPLPTTIGFNITAAGAVKTVALTSALTAPGDGTTVDGGTQTALANSNATGPEIALDGSGILASEFLYAAGIRLRAANCTVKNLAINNFNQQGIYIHGAAAVGNVVSGCYIGLAPTGAAAAPNAYAGVEIDAGAHGNTLGGVTAGERNVISGNGNDGVYFHDAATTANTVVGNYIGLNQAGSGAVPNAFVGVEVAAGASATQIGGVAAGAGNVISGNSLDGIRFNAASGNVAQGNYVGVNKDGSAAVANGFYDRAAHQFAAGVNLYGGAASNTIGGVDPAARNLIAGNAAQGVSISGSGTNGNFVLGNYIGVNRDGSAAVANGAADPAQNYNFSGVGVFGGAQ